MTTVTVPGLDDYLPELIAIRHDLHTHPEIGMDEHRTSAVVADRLKSWGIEAVTGVGRFGVVATIRGNRPGQRAIGLRADMDALPIHEATGLPYASKTPGRMHACGHDGHTTMLLGAARHLSTHRDFAGTVHLIFQPAEEGRGGAVAMLNDGLFERFPCDAIYGLHNAPGVPLGTFSTRKGPFMAGGGAWRAVFTGTGGHGGRPHVGIDLSLPVAHYILALQSIVTRGMSAFDPAVVTVGCIEGGSRDASNVMPSEFRLCGTMRYFEAPIKDVLATRLVELAHASAALHGAKAMVELEWMAVPVINHATETDVAVRAAAALVGDAHVNGAASAVTGGEDFSYMLERTPGSFMHMGQGAGRDGQVHGLHTPTYDFNDAAIPFGIAYWAELVRQELGQPGQR